MLAYLSDNSGARRACGLALLAFALVRCAQVAGLEDYEPPTTNNGGAGTADPEQRPPSCRASLPGAALDCGTSKAKDCCASSLIDGGDYQCLAPPNRPTPIAPFRLDHFEVTVGRFEAFANAVIDGWRPQPGEGKHPAAANYSAADVGWDPAWNAELPSGASSDDWQAHFTRCDASTWTQSSPERSWLPISCVTYFAAMAFCIWDGGYLPSALELSYAARGGDEGRMYPWGNEPIDPQRAAYAPWSEESPRAVGSLPLGDGRWRHSDQVGNVWEWCSYNSVNGGDCGECGCDSFQAGFTDGISFGGSYEARADEAFSTSYQRVPLAPGIYLRDRGIRCARAP